MITVSTVGVFRCCIESVGMKFDGEEKPENLVPLENPKNGDKDNCKYCGREFTLVDSQWKPSEWS